MGVCNSCHTSDEDTKRSQAIEKGLKKSFQNDYSISKILLLGPGESGKSTILKQMKIIHLGGFNNEERSKYLTIVRANCIENMINLFAGAKLLGLDCSDLQDDIQSLTPGPLDLTTSEQDHTKRFVFDESTAVCLNRLWQSKVLQDAYTRRYEFQLSDSASHFFSIIDSLARPNYIPTVEDILRTRVPTTHVVQLDFKISNVPFRVFDIGGQRSERRKWIHYFDNVTAVLFVASLSEYDQVLFEDATVNRLTETLDVFRDVCSSPFFQETSIILLLNKRDLFEEKIKTIDLSDCFPEYKGGLKYDAALGFIKTKFLLLNKSNKPIYVHVTSATDTNQVRFILEAVKDIIVSANIRDNALY